DSSSKRCCRTNGFDHNVWTTAVRQLQQPIVQRFPLCVDDMSAARSSRKFQFFVCHINADCAGSPSTRTSDGAQPHSATTHNQDCVVPGDPSTRYRVKSDRERFN